MYYILHLHEHVWVLVLEMENLKADFPFEIPASCALDRCLKKMEIKNITWLYITVF